MRPLSTVKVEKTVNQISPLLFFQSLIYSTDSYSGPGSTLGLGHNGMRRFPTPESTEAHSICPLSNKASGIVIRANHLTSPHASVLRRALACTVKNISPQVPYWITKHLDFYVCFSREGLPMQDV